LGACNDAYLSSFEEQGVNRIIVSVVEMEKASNPLLYELNAFPLIDNRFEISNLNLVKDMKEMVYFIDDTDTQLD
jgi:hypothetical protein